MAVSTNSLNDISLDSFFQDRILDNNGVSVTDINLGLNNLFKYFNMQEPNMEETQRYLVKEFEDGFPDLVAKKSIMQDQRYWWWLLLANRLENPMTDIKTGVIYSILSLNDINDFVNSSNQSVESGNNSRLGTLVELN